MTKEQILQKWIAYSKFDPNQHSFNLLSANYELHRVGDFMGKILEIEPSGTLALLYAKQQFTKICANTHIYLKTVFSNPQSYTADQEMWNLFHSPDFTAIEEQLLDMLESIISKILPVQIGNRNKQKEQDALLRSVEIVVEEMTGLNEDLFLRSNAPIQVQQFNTHIQVFESLAECLLALTRSPDAMYLCYINCYNTADGYFGFYIKSNGNILSVNERVNEAYPGQHKVSRNGCWQESKKDHLFPYQYIFSFFDHDYKGYPKTQVIDEEKLAFFELGADAYLPLVLAMLLVSQKYNGKSTKDMEITLTLNSPCR